MQAIVESSRGSSMEMQLSFEDFIESGHMKNLSKVNMCSPYDLIVDHLPAFDPGDGEEVREAFAEACEEASEYGLRKVKLDDRDVAYARHEFLENRRFRVVGEYPLFAA